MRVLSGRRPEVMLAAAVIIFITTLIWRTMLSQVFMPAPASSEPAPAPLELGAARTVEQLQERIRRSPDDPSAYAQLGLALLQRVRETADPTLYTRAEQAFAEALKRDPRQLEALEGQGSLALSRHKFADALRYGEQAHQINPYRAEIYGIIGDAQIELGQYEAALDTIQKMVDTRPALNSYSRVSYLRELQGDTAGAIDIMRKAVGTGIPGSENMLWTQVQLGHLYFNSGDLAHAEQTYLEALQLRPDYVYALAGMARVHAARGSYKQAIDEYRRIVKMLPLPEFVIALGEVYEANGQPKEARQQYDLVRAMQQLSASAGVDVDLELALFDADHPLTDLRAGGADPGQAVERARGSYARRPSIYGADALAWALYQHGDYAEARRYSDLALRLGTRDATMHYHAAMIALALNDRAGAREHLRQALAINPYFSVRYVEQVRQKLAELDRSN
ncbi:MAG TPA: tetratricopeptide repeat protein [Roseiflexaceae bacterium]|nr:tetratricopeptide repeat protein [Roseiflexaceae bacterium]